MAGGDIRDTDLSLQGDNFEFMREIKFRAWDGESMYVPVIQDNDPDSTINEFFESCDKITVMQFTGLLDRNGKEIYEGDIVKPVQTKGMRWKLATVEYQRGEFVILPKGETRSFKTLTETGWLKIEVIGNVWENSELLT